MKRASYRAAIFWMVANDDTEWLDEGPNASPSVTATLTADLFAVSTERVTKDLRRERVKQAGGES